MCKYCDNWKNRDISHLDINTTIVSDKPFSRKALLIPCNGSSTNRFAFTINYCPFCGKKLV